MWQMTFGSGIAMFGMVLSVITGLVVLILKLKPVDNTGSPFSNITANQVKTLFDGAFTLDEKLKMLKNCDEIIDILTTADDMGRYRIFYPRELVEVQQKTLEIQQRMTLQLENMTEILKGVSANQSHTAMLLQTLTERMKKD